MDAIYGRQSLDKKDSISIETQIEKALAVRGTEDNNYIVYTDKGYSGKNTKRPAYQEMMRDVETGKIKRIIVYRLDRFSRSLLDFSIAWEFMNKHDVEFISVNEKFDTSTPIGKAMVFIIMIFAQLERETIIERVTDNYYERCKKGSWPGGPAPYGFDLTRIPCEGKMVPSLSANENIEIVKRIFTSYVEDDVSLGSLSRMLNQEGVEPIKRETWNNVTLSRMLKNPVYVKMNADIYAYYKNKGVNIENDIEDFTGEYGGSLVGKRGRNPSTYRDLSKFHLNVANWEGVIEPEIFIQVQKKLASNKQVRNTGKGTHTWLTGIIKCGYCKRAMRIGKYKNKDNYEIRYMNCSGRADQICDKVTRQKLDEVESEVQKEIEKLLENCVDEEEEVKTEITNEDKIRLGKIEEELFNLIAVIKNGTVSETMINYINKEVERLEQEKQSILTKVDKQVKKRKLEKIIFDKLDFEGKKLVAKSLIDVIYVYIDETDIVWKV